MEKLFLPPGFRFHPTDEELVSYYLRRKVCGRKFAFEAIADMDLYKYEPCDLPEKSILQTRDLEWYFFNPRDRKYSNGSRTNRATEKGYWKSTGKDRSVSSGSRAVGRKKTLVYYNGRAPKGERTNWVMHEYRLNDVECQRIHAKENGFVLCRVYQKSGPGPRNGEQYGGPVEDGDFEDSPTVEGDLISIFKSELIERGPRSTSVHYGGTPPGCGNDAVSRGIDIAGQQLSGSGFQPRSLNTHFEDLCGDFQEGSIQTFACSATGGSMFPVFNGELVESAFVVPSHHEEEHNMLLEMFEQLESADGYQDAPISVDDGCYQPGARTPDDGDFLELNDLLPDGIEFVRHNEEKASIGSMDYSAELQCSSVQALATFNVNGQWKNLAFGNGVREGQQVIPEHHGNHLQEIIQMQSSISTVYDSQYQPSKSNMLGSSQGPAAVYNGELGAAGHTGSVEPEDENVWKLIDHLNACAGEMGLVENIHRGLYHSEDNPAIPLQDGHYYDAMLSFTDINVCGEVTDTNLQASYDNGMSEVTLAQASLASKMNEDLNKLEHPDRVLQANDLSPEFCSLSQDDAVCLEQRRHPSSPISLFLSILDSLPTLPASAADLSPRATSPGGSIRVTATNIGAGAVSVTCTCVGESVPSSCVNCSVAEVENKGRFHKSLSYAGKRKKSSDMGFFLAAVFGGLLAVFGMLIVGGAAWKLWGGVYKFMITSKT